MARSEIRPRQIGIALSNDEWEAIKERADARGCSMIQYLRSVGTGQPLRRRDVDTKMITAALSRIGTNVNQIAARLNEARKDGYAIPESIFGEITETLGSVRRSVNTLAGIVTKADAEEADAVIDEPVADERLGKKILGK